MRANKLSQSYGFQVVAGTIVVRVVCVRVGSFGWCGPGVGIRTA